MARPTVIPLENISQDSAFSMVDRFHAIGSDHKALMLDYPGGQRIVILVCRGVITEEIVDPYAISAELRCKRFVAAGVGCKGDHTFVLTGYLGS